MAEHNVYVELPTLEVGKVDAIFKIFQDGKVLGRIELSKGGIDWYPTNAKVPLTLGWEHFDKMFKEYHGKV